MFRPCPGENLARFLFAEGRAVLFQAADETLITGTGKVPLATAVRPQFPVMPSSRLASSML